MTLSESIEAFVALKRSLGRKFVAEAWVLARFEKFVAFAGCELDAGTFTAWSASMSHLRATTRRRRLRIARSLCLYRRRTVPGCFVPDADTFPSPQPYRRPYIFTRAEIARLLAVADGLRPHKLSPLRSSSYRLVVVLLYTAGLRRGELCRLRLGDFDDEEATLQIRSSKFRKSRLVALSTDAAMETRAFIEARRQLSDRDDDPLFVRWSEGEILERSGPGMGRALRLLFRRAGIRKSDGTTPRVHDLRHTHAVHALLRWYRAGEDVQARLPALAASMGHVSVASTAHYLSFVEPLAQAASDKFARHCAFILQPEVGP